MMEEGVPAVICFNKRSGNNGRAGISLWNIPELRLSGDPVKCPEGEGLDEIEEVLQGRTTVVAGPSGVGKSSLTNSFRKKWRWKPVRSAVSWNWGKHTTRHAQIIPVAQDTFLVDTPGFSSLYIENMEEQELKDYFPEFRRYEGQCRFQGCRHIHEPGCAVKEALENNEISRLRYEDYLELHQELKEKRRYWVMEYRLCPSMLHQQILTDWENRSKFWKEGVEYLHIDVMDGDFVPSISFGMPVIKSIRKNPTCFSTYIWW